MKGEQLDVAIAYQKIKSSKRQGKRVTGEEFLWREKQRKKIRLLNGRYRGMHDE